MKSAASSPEVLDLIEPVQPRRREDRAHWVVYELDRVDKHNTLTEVPLVPSSITYDLTFGTAPPQSLCTRPSFVPVRATPSVASFATSTRHRAY